MITHHIGPIASGFRLLSGVPEAWATVFNTATNGFSGNWHNYTVRSFIARGYLLAGATKFRITFSSHAGATLEINKAYLGESVQNIYGTPPVQMFFGGSPSVIIPPGTSVTSDDVTLSYGGILDLCASFYVPASADAAGRHYVSGVPSNYYGGSVYFGGDVANATGMTAARGSNLYNVTKVEMFTGGNWKEINKYANTYLSNGWNNYTLRSRINSGLFAPTQPYIRLGYMANMSKCFVGVGVSNASLNFDGTPYQVTFGGLPNTGTEINKIYFSDDIPSNIFDITKSTIFSHHQSTNYVNVGPIPAGGDSRYAGGDLADDITFGGSGYGGNFFGPLLIDEKY